MKIISVVGARPNFIKMAPIDRAIRKNNLENPIKKITHMICHTGQHYDMNMSGIFFNHLELPEPDYYLMAGSGSHAVQTAKIMIEFEKVLIKEKPDVVLVYGDVNSTVACSIVAAKMNIRIAHIEAGLRSFDRQMPEEINRILTDHMADYLFVSENAGIVNLKNEGINAEKAFFTGNVMIDSLVNSITKCDKLPILENLVLEPQKYILVTMHRPSNVDDAGYLISIIRMFNELSATIKIVFPVHPRTRNRINECGILPGQNLILIEPVGYLDFLALLKNSQLVITDSGGIQEETTYLGVQCITARNNTERPVTVECGTNHLGGTDINNIKDITSQILNGNVKKGRIPDFWDGRASERIINSLINISI